MQPTIGNTLGAGFLGTVASAILFGVTVVQAHLYYVEYPNDWLFQKTSVGILLVVDALHLALTVYGMYQFLIVDFGQIPETFIWSFKLQVALNVLVVIVVQSLYALRIWKVGRHFSRFWAIFIVLIVSATYAVGIAVTVGTYETDTWAEVKRWTVVASYSTATGVDIILSIAMCHYLQQSKTSFTDTNNRIVTAMRYVLTSGSLTSAGSLTSLICYLTMSNNLVFLGISFVVSKLYINSYIAMLNSRKAIVFDQDSSFFKSVNSPQLSNLRKQKGKNGPTTADKISAIGFRNPLDDECSIHDMTDKRGVIELTVRRTEERMYDEESHRDDIKHGAAARPEPRIGEI